MSFTVPGQPDDETPPMFALAEEHAPAGGFDLFTEHENRHALKIDIS